MNINTIPDIVKLTLGAKGKTILLPDGHLTKDGVSVAKAFRTNKIIDEVIKQACLQTLSKVGDGTTSTLVLIQSIYKTLKRKSLPRIEKQLEEEFELINSIIKSESKPIKTKKNLYDVAYISSNGDEEISKNVSEIYHKIGKDGDVTLEISEKKDTYYKIDNGFKVKDGVVSPSMLNGNSEIFKNPVIMVCRDEIRNIKQVLSILEDCFKENKPFILVCDKVDSETISSFIINRIETKYRKQMAIISTIDDCFDNLALLTDSQVVDSDIGKSSYEVNPDWLGTCEKVILEKDKAVFVHTKETKDKPKDMKKKDWDRIISKVATLNIGGNSRPETLEKVDRYDDSLRSTQSSYEEGYCKGGGYVWLKASEQVTLLKKPMQSVFRQMCKNAGYSRRKTNRLIKEILEYNIPYNFKTESFGDENHYNENGNWVSKYEISDSAKVLRVSLESAYSISKLLLNTGEILEPRVGVLKRAYLYLWGTGR